jgi:hypothetical protein
MFPKIDLFLSSGEMRQTTTLADKLQKPGDSECYTLSSEPFRKLVPCFNDGQNTPIARNKIGIFPQWKYPDYLTNSARRDRDRSHIYVCVCVCVCTYILAK